MTTVCISRSGSYLITFVQDGRNSRENCKWFDDHGHMRLCYCLYCIVHHTVHLFYIPVYNFSNFWKMSLTPVVFQELPGSMCVCVLIPKVLLILEPHSLCWSTYISVCVRLSKLSDLSLFALAPKAPAALTLAKVYSASARCKLVKIYNFELF